MTKCHICFGKFEEDNYRVPLYWIVRLALRICNLRYKIPRYIPVVFHNLSSYNAHLFIRELGKKSGSGSISVIAENKEKYISFNADVVVGTYEDT